MSATVTVNPKKYARLANRIVVKALDTEEEYDRMVAAVEQLIDKGEDRLSPESPHYSKRWRYWSRLTTTAITLCLRLPPTRC
jgi:hypothetical protein